MAIVCPQCSAPAINSAEAVDAAGRMLRCARCGTNWLPRVGDGKQHKLRPLPTTSKPRGRRFERVIEHIDADFPRMAAPRPEKPAGRVKPPPSSSAWRHLPIAKAALTAWSGVAAAVVIVVVAVVAFDPSVVGASPGEQTARFGGLEVHLVTSAADSNRYGRALDVRGEITNRTDREIAVPAVRLSLHADGTELYSWIVEPTTTWLAGREVVHFRSQTVAPSAEYDEVLFALTERRNIVIGAR